jgi:hypothetical protein
MRGGNNSQNHRSGQEQEEVDIQTYGAQKRSRCQVNEVREPPTMWLPPAAISPPQFVGSIWACAVAAQL